MSPTSGHVEGYRAALQVCICTSCYGRAHVAAVELPPVYGVRLCIGRCVWPWTFLSKNLLQAGVRVNPGMTSRGRMMQLLGRRQSQICGRRAPHPPLLRPQIPLMVSFCRGCCQYAPEAFVWTCCVNVPGVGHAEDKVRESSEARPQELIRLLLGHLQNRNELSIAARPDLSRCCL